MLQALEGRDIMSGTSFHNTTIDTTVNKLLAIKNLNCCDVCNSGTEKTNYDFQGMLEDGTPFTVYDWKEYRPIGLDEVIEFHIGGRNRSETDRARNVLRELI